jgi:folate/biopterin transporter
MSTAPGLSPRCLSKNENIHAHQPYARRNVSNPSSYSDTSTRPNLEDSVPAIDTEPAVVQGFGFISWSRNIIFHSKNFRSSTFVVWIRKVHATFGLSSLTLVSVVYFVQGFGSFSQLSVSYLIKDTLKLQPAASQTVMTTASFPWNVKPLYGVLSDSLPLCGYHRKSYLILINLIGAFAYLGLHSTSIDTSVMHLTLLLFLVNLATAVSDVIIDALVVQMARADPKNGANDLQSITWVMMSVGGIIGSVLVGPTTSHFGPTTSLLIAALGPCLVLSFSVCMPETKVQTRSSFSSSYLAKASSCTATARMQVKLLWGAFKVPVIWRAALFLFLSHAISPSYSQIQFYFNTDILHFPPEFLGNVSALGYVFLMCGTIMYNSTWLKDLPLRTILLWAQLALAFVSILEVIIVTRFNLVVGIPDKWFVLGDAMIADITARMKTMPLLVLCAKLCPKGIEGSFFALLMAISNLSSTASAYWGAYLCTWLNISRTSYEFLWIAIVIRSLMKLFPISFLFLVPATDPQNEVDAVVLQGCPHKQSVFHQKTSEIEEDADIVQERTELLHEEA